MDLSWNFAAESQAYDRVHRLGQEKDVFVKRLVVENTIEERMLRLQDVKTGAHLSPFLICFYINRLMDWCASCRIGRCGFGRRYGCETAQAKCRGDQKGACVPVPLSRSSPVPVLNTLTFIQLFGMHS